MECSEKEIKIKVRLLQHLRKEWEPERVQSIRELFKHKKIENISWLQFEWKRVNIFHLGRTTFLDTAVAKFHFAWDLTSCDIAF